MMLFMIWVDMLGVCVCDFKFPHYAGLASSITVSWPRGANILDMYLSVHKLLLLLLLFIQFESNFIAKVTLMCCRYERSTSLPISNKSIFVAAYTILKIISLSSHS